MLWHVEIEAAGTLTDDQGEQLAIDGDIFSVHVDGNAGVVRMSATVEADTYPSAFDGRWREPVDRLIADGTLAQPSRIVVEDEETHRRSLDLIGANETARVLRISTARVRKLHDRPDWPKPVFVLPGGEQIHTRSAIEAFDAGWDRTPGRPPKGS